jgi:glycosyltransferase involved in cell wall biosynthesis
VSAAEADQLRRDFGTGIRHISVVHNGADTAAIRAAAPWPAQPPTVLAVGRLEPYKRIDRAMQAFATTTGGQLVIIGEGPDRTRLERIAGGDERVRFLGRLDDEHVARWLRTARAVVSMSEHEAFGLVALEGAAGGGRVLLSDIAAHREVAALIGDTATVIGADDELARAVKEALRTPNDGDRQVRSWSDVAAEHLAVYRQVVATS